jgi:hypothetical protein
MVRSKDARSATQAAFSDSIVVLVAPFISRSPLRVVSVCHIAEGANEDHENE